LAGRTTYHVRGSERLRLSDEQLRISVAHRLGCKACEPHTCGCGKVVDARGLQGPDFVIQRASGPVLARRQTPQRHHNPAARNWEGGRP